MINQIRSSKSKTYLLPLISKDIEIEFNYLLNNCFIIFDKDITIPYPFGMLYEMEDSPEFEAYNQYLINHPLFDKSFIVNENNKLYVFNFPERFICEYKLFKQGLYSQFSTEAKSLIISYSAFTYKYPPLIEDITGVLYRHKIRKAKLEKELDVVIPDGCELASKINIDEETFKFA
jgi:hypothetical protein